MEYNVGFGSLNITNPKDKDFKIMQAKTMDIVNTLQYALFDSACAWRTAIDRYGRMSEDEKTKAITKVKGRIETIYGKNNPIISKYLCLETLGHSMEPISLLLGVMISDAAKSEFMFEQYTQLGRRMLGDKIIKDSIDVASISKRLVEKYGDEELTTSVSKIGEMFQDIGTKLSMFREKDPGNKEIQAKAKEQSV